MSVLDSIAWPESSSEEAVHQEEAVDREEQPNKRQKFADVREELEQEEAVDQEAMDQESAIKSLISHGFRTTTHPSS